MPRLTISLPDNLYQRVLSRASEKNESLSQVINELILKGDQMCDERDSHMLPIEQHCQQLIMQMNAIVKSLAVEILKFEQADFDELWDSVRRKYILKQKR